eukprot:2986987-Pyramimonas_sp.AAC.2
MSQEPSTTSVTFYIRVRQLCELPRRVKQARSFFVRGTDDRSGLRSELLTHYRIGRFENAVARLNSKEDPLHSKRMGSCEDSHTAIILARKHGPVSNNKTYMPT